MKFYPEKCMMGAVSDAAQAKWWLKEADPDLLTPMYCQNQSNFYIFKPTSLLDGTMCVPVRFYQQCKDMWFQAWVLNPDFDRDGWVVNEHNIIHRTVSCLGLNGVDILQGASIGPGLPKPEILGKLCIEIGATL